jgi:two-component system sensor histidine kinase PilS (NtrC family)
MIHVKRELQRQLSALMIGRVILLTVLLASGLIIGRLLQQPLVGSDHFYLLTGAGYALTILYAALHPFWSRHRVAAYVQVAGDLALVTGFVYVTGGVDSPFSLLYFLVLIAASIMLGKAGAVCSATGAWFTYALLVVLIVSGWLPDPPSGLRDGWSASPPGAAQPELKAEAVNRHVAYSLFSHFLGFFTVAMLSSYLTSQLEATGEELEENREVLAKVQALNTNIIDSITSGIITTDLGGRIMSMNRGGEVITGRTLAQVEGAGVAEFLAEADPFLDRVKQNLDRDRRFRFEISLPRSEGASIFLGFTSALLKDQRGEPMGYIFSFQDLTDIKALEEEVRLKDRMAALGEMAAGIAHEIRNPLASMSGSVQMLKKSLHPSEEEGELLDIVLRESKRLDGIIRDFLIFAKPGRFQPAPVDLVPLLKDSLTLLRNSAEFGGRHRLESDFGPGPALALVDPNMIKQVFWNLAKNSLRAMPDGGTLRVRVRKAGAGSVVVSIADEGIGMSETQLRHAFEPFQGGFREGTGLGLAVVFRIVQEHGGRIHVQSRVNDGTEVSVTLPAAHGAATQRPIAAAAVAGQGRSAS